MLPKKSEQECWRKFASNINRKTPISQKRTAILEDNGQMYTSDLAIAKAIAQKLCQISDHQNYSPNFQRKKI